MEIEFLELVLSHPVQCLCDKAEQAGRGHPYAFGWLRRRGRLRCSRRRLAARREIRIGRISVDGHTRNRGIAGFVWFDLHAVLHAGYELRSNSGDYWPSAGDRQSSAV